MTPAVFLDLALGPALRLLPSRMDTPEARAIVLAICLQESGLRHRRQIGGPARGYAQFELTGCAGVLSHHASQVHATRICETLDIVPAPNAVYAALEYQDVLAAAFARLLLWTLPQALPDRGDHEGAWRQYVDAWRPGRPHRETWDAHMTTAWAAIA